MTYPYEDARDLLERELQAAKDRIAELEAEIERWNALANERDTRAVLLGLRLKELESRNAAEKAAAEFLDIYGPGLRSLLQESLEMLRDNEGEEEDIERVGYLLDKLIAALAPAPDVKVWTAEDDAKLNAPSDIDEFFAPDVKAQGAERCRGPGTPRNGPCVWCTSGKPHPGAELAVKSLTVTRDEADSLLDEFDAERRGGQP